MCFHINSVQFLQFICMYLCFFNPLWPKNSLKLCFSISECTNIFPLSLCYWLLVWFHCTSRTHSSGFLLTYFMAWDMVSVGIYSLGTWKEHVFCCYWVVCFCRSDFVSWWYWVFTTLLLFCQMTSLAGVKATEISKYNYGFACFSFQIYQSLPHLFCCSVVWCLHI